MPNMTRYLIILLMLASCAQQVVAHIYDNRFFHLLRVPYSRERLFCDPYCEPEQGHWGESRYRNDIFVLTANDACDDDKEIGIPEIFGRYDQRKVDKALAELNGTQPILDQPPFENTSIEWRVKGKLQGQGISFTYDQKLTDWLYAGASFSFMHMTSRERFFFTQDEKVEPQLDKIRRQFNNELGIVSTKWSHSGITDIDAYLRIGSVWNYILKCRRIDAGFSFGGILPAGEQRDIANPASVPFGGNGHYGLFWDFDAEFELKEDLKFGALVRISKRFAKTKLERMPLQNEQQLFGALVGPVRIDPGLTVVASPYLRVEGIRDGLGVYVNYTAIFHDNDTWEDARTGSRTPRPTFFEVFKHSNWASETVTLNFFYDFTKVRVPGSFLPLISLSWDIPVQYFVAHDVVKTNHIALGIEFTF